jgi:phage tail-like protein
MTEKIIYPFAAFNFSIEINVPDLSFEVCSAAFSECDGLEMNMEVKTIREGGNNGRQIRLAGPITFGQLTLKRGMTDNFDLWSWFQAVVEDPSLRASAEVVLLDADHETEKARFILSRCLPVKLKAPPLNAKDGMVAIEELQISYESLRFEPPSGDDS